MKDLFGNTKPVQIETNEWWFNGRIIQKQNDSRLPEWISFADSDINIVVSKHITKKEAIYYAIGNPCRMPQHKPEDYIE
ncbi:MAG TPA: hypothetical protein VFM65_08785 [Flavobacteriaceae bacterium]|nr:hypothetical protein [Flavobacteriaceae bacterium]